VIRITDERIPIGHFPEGNSFVTKDFQRDSRVIPDNDSNMDLLLANGTRTK
jgi:hypothetical protein